ncbi:MAG: hypothetical protein IKK84_05750 [Clostridia bacterium]|nr:hypothetical protein [Clostridia bacterium]MBR6640798.1 hypothetical protein [Clostridia bacterium]
MNKNKKIICLIVLISIIVVSITNVYAAASTPTLINKLNTALKKILTYLEKLATPAAGVAIATGVMIRKLSFGDEEKLILGKRTIINAIIGYLTIQLIDLIIKFIEEIV